MTCLPTLLSMFNKWIFCRYRVNQCGENAVAFSSPNDDAAEVTATEKYRLVPQLQYRRSCHDARLCANRRWIVLLNIECCIYWWRRSPCRRSLRKMRDETTSSDNMLSAKRCGHRQLTSNLLTSGKSAYLQCGVYALGQLVLSCSVLDLKVLAAIIRVLYCAAGSTPSRGQISVAGSSGDSFSSFFPSSSSTAQYLTSFALLVSIFFFFFWQLMKVVDFEISIILWAFKMLWELRTWSCRIDNLSLAVRAVASLTKCTS